MYTLKYIFANALQYPLQQAIKTCTLKIRKLPPARKGSRQLHQIKPFMQKSILYAFVLLLFVISCQPKKDSPIDPKNEPVKKCRLVKMIQGTHNGAVHDTTFNFYYNAAGKLNMVTGAYAGYNTDTSLLTYNDSGKLVKIIPPGFINGTTFTYTSNGLLSEIYHPHIGYEKWRFVYNGSSTLPEKCIFTTYTSYPPNITHLDSMEYRYTAQNGNIVSKETFSHGISTAKSTFEYDTIPNLNADLSLIGLRDEAIGFYEEFCYFNKNLIKRKVSTYDTYNVTYKLDSGKVVQSLTYETTPPGETRNYFWECN